MDLYWLDPTDPVRVQLWDAISRFTISCGGDTGAKPTVERMNAVVAVEKAVAAAAERLIETTQPPR